jgi:hypothetical protein
MTAGPEFNFQRNFVLMIENIDAKWKELVAELEKKFGGELDLSAVLFLIGVQELGKGYKKFTKNEKLDVMHIATCTLLEQYGYYEFLGKDDAGWPHWKRLKKLPPLNSKEQTALMKRAILEYFKAW